MLTEAEALARIVAAVPPSLGRETVDLWTAGDRALAEDAHATVPLPRFDNSSVDGYALRAADARDGALLRVRGVQPAGPTEAAERALDPGEALRIFTGAPLPPGADAVVMQEDCERSGDAVRVPSAVESGENVRRAGGDLSEGQKMLVAGTTLRGPQLALLASQGWPRVPVHRRPRVAVLATGSELRAMGDALRPGEIFESNRIMLADAVRRAGAEPRLQPVVPDDAAAHLEAFQEGARQDAIVVAGGVSVGERDLVKPTLRDLGANLDLWRVRVRPGKPFLFGRLGSAWVFGLPGNPVSAFVTFLLFVRPALLRLGGHAAWREPRPTVEAGEDLHNGGDRPHYLRVRVQDGVARAVGRQESHALFALAGANALVPLEPGQTVRAGEHLPSIRFGAG